MLSPQALIRGLVSRALPTVNADSSNNDVAIRMDSYGGVYTQPMIRKNHALCDEGSYWTANTAQTGVTPPLGVAWSATVAAMIIYNNDQLQRRLYLDYISLTNIVAVTMTSATAGAPNFCAFYTDTGNRLSSGGTTLNAATNPNYIAGIAPPGVTITFGNLTATAAVASRAIVGERVLRPNATTAAATVVGDQFYFNFGAVEATMASTITITNPNLIPIPMPPVVIPFGSSGILNIWWANTSPAGGSAGFLPEVGFFVR